jgi:lysine 2,3-aminomutase
MIAIFKTYNTCARICVYYQRNWEIEGILSEDAMAPAEKIEAALKWFEEHPAITEVLITGGDPAMLPNTQLRYVLGRRASMPHIRRLRLGTRVPVVLPMRIDTGFLEALAEVHEPPRSGARAGQPFRALLSDFTGGRRHQVPSLPWHLHLQSAGLHHGELPAL